jgi:hypothetical protein
MKSRLPEMLSEEFDKKIRDAAESHHPTYDEKAWGGMKQLLDKHMPEEKEDRRRILFFLLFFLLLGGGAWYFIGKSSGKKEKETVVAATVSLKENSPSTTDDKQTANVVAVPVPVTKTDNSSPVHNEPQDHLVSTGPEKKDVRVTVKPVSKPTAVTSATVKPAGKTSNAVGKKKRENASLAPSADDKIVKKSLRKDDVVEPVPSLDNKKDEPGKKNNSLSDAGTQKTSEPTPPVAIAKKEEPKTTDKKAEEKKPNETEVVKKEKKTSKKSNSFSLSVSGGPDASFTGGDKMGKMKFLGGVGMGYTIKERITVRTGFYSARKIYTASPGEYHGSDLFNTYYPNMQKIEADCKVYEIPLSVSYNFKRTDKQNFFASAGLSTYLMKRETYDYYYKYYPTAPTISKEHTTRNQNNHYFSVLSVSAGYQRNIGKRVSVTAEPYFKLPLKGVGDGKVKLNSAGLLFTLSVKPFKQAEKK